MPPLWPWRFNFRLGPDGTCAAGADIPGAAAFLCRALGTGALALGCLCSTRACALGLRCKRVFPTFCAVHDHHWLPDDMWQPMMIVPGELAPML